MIIYCIEPLVALFTCKALWGWGYNEEHLHMTSYTEPLYVWIVVVLGGNFSYASNVKKLKDILGYGSRTAILQSDCVSLWLSLSLSLSFPLH